MRKKNKKVVRFNKKNKQASIIYAKNQVKLFTLFY